MIEVKVPTFAFPRKNLENPCPCEDRPVELTYKTSQVFWQVDDGATVTEDQSIADLEVEKKTLDIKAPASGILKIYVEDGTEVDVDTVIAVIQ